MVLCPGWDGEGWGRRAGERQRGCPAKRGKHGRRSVSGAGLAAKTVRHFALASLFETAVAAGGGKKKKKKTHPMRPVTQERQPQEQKESEFEPRRANGQGKNNKKEKEKVDAIPFLFRSLGLYKT